MTRDGKTEPSGAVVRVIVVLAASLVIGSLESWAQGFLPGALRPLSNSASGWAVITALLVAWSRVEARTAAVLGGASFVLLVVGYAATSSLRGYSYSPLLWGVIGAVAGPFVGVAAAWLRTRDLRAAIGAALLAGIGLGDAFFGLAMVSETTGVVYWIAVGVAALILILCMLLLGRVRGALAVVTLVGGALAVALLQCLAFSLF